MRFIVLASLVAATAFAGNPSEYQAARRATSALPMVAAPLEQPKATPPTVASFQEAVDLFRSGAMPSVDEVRGWFAGVKYWGDHPYLPEASILTSSADGTSPVVRIMPTIAPQMPSDYYYTLDEAKVAAIRANYLKKEYVYTTAHFETGALVSMYSGGGYLFKSAARRLADGRLAVVSYEASRPRILGAGVYDKKVFPLAQSTELLGAFEYTGGFVKDLQLTVADKRALVGFELVVPGFCAGVEALEASVKVAGAFTKLKTTPGATTFKLPSAMVVDALTVSLNGPSGKSCPIPVYGVFRR